MLKDQQHDINPATFITPILAASDFTDLDADNAASSTSGAAITDEAYATEFLHDKDVFPDSFFVRMDTKPSVAALLRFGYVNDGQSIAAAVLADQFLDSAGVDLNGETNNTYFEVTPTETAYIPEGGLLFLWISTDPTDLAGMRVGMRWTERRVVQ